MHTAQAASSILYARRGEETPHLADVPFSCAHGDWGVVQALGRMVRILPASSIHALAQLMSPTPGLFQPGCLPH